MKDYTSTTPNNYKERIKIQGEKLFYKTWDNSSEAFSILVGNETESKKVIIQQHVNPLNEQLEDKKLMCLDKDLGNLTWGSVITGYETNEKHLVITRPYSNGVYSVCKIRRLKNNTSFSINDEVQSYLGILADNMLYTDKSYVGDTNVFDEEDKKALVLPYDNNTKLLKMFDEIRVDDIEYKIVQIDNVTMKEHDEEFGVLQLVLLNTNFGALTLNSSNKEFVGILRFARLKERVYNSLGREILTPHGVLNTGDYITQSFKRGDIQDDRTYIVRSRVDKRLSYDSTFVIECLSIVKLLDKDGTTIHTYPVVFQDNKTKMSDNTRSDIAIIGNSTFQIYVRYDDITRRFVSNCDAGQKIDRIIVDEDAYEIVGRPDIGSMRGLMTLQLKEDDIQPNIDNLELGIADYYNNILSPTPTPSEIIGDSEIYLGDTLEYSIDSTYPCTWSINDVGIDIISTNDNKCTVKCRTSTQYKGNTATLTCITNGQTYTKHIKIIGF